MRRAVTDDKKTFFKKAFNKNFNKKDGLNSKILIDNLQVTTDRRTTVQNLMV